MRAIAVGSWPQKRKADHGESSRAGDGDQAGAAQVHEIEHAARAEAADAVQRLREQAAVEDRRRRGAAALFQVDAADEAVMDARNVRLRCGGRRGRPSAGGTAGRPRRPGTPRRAARPPAPGRRAASRCRGDRRCKRAVAPAAAAGPRRGRRRAAPRNRPSGQGQPGHDPGDAQQAAGAADQPVDRFGVRRREGGNVHSHAFLLRGGTRPSSARAWGHETGESRVGGRLGGAGRPAPRRL